MTRLTLLMAFAVSLCGTWLVLRQASTLALMDVPNSRSSHVRPTPRGGGVAIAVAVLAAWLSIGIEEPFDRSAITLIALSGAVLAIVGFVDDRRSLSPALRFLLQSIAVVPVVAALGGLPPVQIGSTTLHPGLTGMVLADVAVLWFLNLFNFMDGIDGIAASEAIFVAAGAGLLTRYAGADAAVAIAFAAVAAASAGFLVWNWAPARIFMGDTGSAFLGGGLALLAIWAAQRSSFSVWSAVVLGAAFIGDATATVVRRFLRGDRVYEAHRSHAYQRLARRWRSHARVTIALCAIDVCVLLPLGWASVRWPSWAPAVAIATVSVAVAAAWLLGGGLPDEAA